MNIDPGIPRAINFLIFAGILIYFLRKPLSRFLSGRVEGIRRDLSEARAKKESVEARLREIESRLGRLDETITELRTTAEQESLAEQARIRAATQTELEKLRVFAGREIEGAKSAAILELKAFAARKSVELAEVLVRGEMRVEDDRRWVSDFADGLKEVKR